jgi:hypothetical protein
MNGRERILTAMRMEKPDKVPVMCQPSWGFVLLHNPDISPLDIWHNHDGAYARAFTNVSKQFGFDGALLPGVGLAALDMDAVDRIDRNNAEGPIVYFNNGDSCIYCYNDLPRYSYVTSPEKDFESFDPETIPERLVYHPPSNHLKMTLNETEEGRTADIRQALAFTHNELSVHGEMYSPQDFLIDLFGPEESMMALLTDPDKCREIMLSFAHAIAEHGAEQIAAGASAMKVSAPWAGQGFLSKQVYEEVLVPSLKVLTDMCREQQTPCYCHTCGAIDDRLELIMNVGFNGIECLDPPPLGNVELADAFKRIGERAFIKGNIDPVNVLMNGTPEQVTADVLHRLEVGVQGRGFILSTACAIAPSTPPENVALLRELVDKHGIY